MPGTSTVVATIFDGSRQLMAAGVDSLITLRDGAQRNHVSRFFRANRIEMTDVPVRDGPDDGYAVLASARKRKDAGFFPVQVQDGATHEVHLMLLHRDASFHFRPARWETLRASSPDLFQFLAGGDPGFAKEQYEELMDDEPQCLACLLNITKAIEKLPLPDAVLKKFRQIELTRMDDQKLARGVRQDRFFAYADRDLAEVIKNAPPQIFEPANPGLHPGADLSFKEIRFGEANLQFTFHSSDTRRVGNADCVKVEMDMDYYRDLGAHSFLEVIPNSFAKLLHVDHRTDPAQIYALRWMAGQNAAAQEEFDPPYTLETDPA